MLNGRDKELSKAYLDILNGYSKVKYIDKFLYIKHFGIFDEALIGENYEEVYAHAQHQGLPTEAERLQVLSEEGFWGKADERKIELNRVEIEELEKKLAKTIIKKQKEKILKNLSSARDQIDKSQLKRQEMLHDTCESFAQFKSMNYSVWLSFYIDEGLTEKAWDKEGFDSMDRADLNELIALYNLKMKEISISNLKKISISAVFSNYFYLSDSVSDFFGKRILDLTFFQTSLASYGRMFKNIQENNSDIPESVLNDPDALFDFAKSKNEGADVSSKLRDTEGAYSRVGATKEDMIDSGVSNSKAKDLHALSKEKGKALGWEDFAK
tara:strand:+ start:521 stop:1498 length:978 start_codon:yes stop_codon:yes gene_type:complete